jgi:hypothetical protein
MALPFITPLEITLGICSGVDCGVGSGVSCPVGNSTSGVGFATGRL